jgi:hypothetical protein
MNRKQFGILIVLLVVLGGAAWLVQRSHNRDLTSGEQSAGRKLLGDSFPMNDVAQISIKQGTNALDLVKKDDLWRVGQRYNYPASFSEISGFLMKASDLKVVQTEDIGPSQLPRLQLAVGQGTNSAIVVDLKGKDGKSLKTLSLGKLVMGKSERPQQFQFGSGEVPEGRYVAVGGNDKQAFLVADALSSIEPTPKAWLDKDFFKIERPKAVAVSFPTETNSWKIVRDTESGDWKLADSKGDEKLDAARASDVSSPFASASFEDVMPPNKILVPDDPKKAPIITVDTFDDLTYTIIVGPKWDANFPVGMTVAAHFPSTRIPAKDEKPEDKDKADKAWKERQKQIETKVEQTKKFENWTYLVPTWNVEPLLKIRKDLLAVKKDEQKQADKTDASGQPNVESLLPPGTASK